MRMGGLAGGGCRWRLATPSKGGERGHVGPVGDEVCKGDGPMGGPLTSRDGQVRLRPVKVAEDVATAVAWYRDPVVLWGSEGSTEPFTPERVARMYEVLAARGEVYIVEVQGPDGFIAVGDAALSAVGVPIVIGEASWRGRGIGRQVLALLIARAQALGLPELVAHQIYADNRASLRLYEGAGFRVVSGGEEGGRPFFRLRLPLEGPESADAGSAPALL